MNGLGSACVWPSSVTWYSCMTSSSALCVLAGARLISSASSRCVNTGPRTMRISIGLRIEHRVAGDVGGHHVRRELHASVAELQGLRHGAHQQRLAESGDTFDEHVAGRHQREHHFLDHARLPDDRLADAGAQLAEQVGGFLDGAGFSFHVLTLLFSRTCVARFRAPRWHGAARASCAPRNNCSAGPSSSARVAAELGERGHARPRSTSGRSAGRCCSAASRNARSIAACSARAAAEAQRELPGAADLLGQRASCGLGGRRSAVRSARRRATATARSSTTSSSRAGAPKRHSSVSSEALIFLGKEHAASRRDAAASPARTASR